MTKRQAAQPGFRLIVLILITFTVLAGGALVYKSGAVAADDHAPGGPPPGPMPVIVDVIKPTTAQIWSEYSGRLTAVDYVELRPQVSGTVKEIRFEDGQMVKKGDILYVIDPAPYEAAVAQAAADLATAQSQNEFAKKQLQRAEGLMATNAISKDLLDERQNAARVGKGAVDAASARLKQAKINIDYAYVKAPIGGRVGRAEITEGNLVQAGPNAPVLTTILSNEEIYADFDVDEMTYTQIRRAAHGVDAERAIQVQMTAKGDRSVVYEGTIHSFDNRINTDTGTIRARALFKNEDGTLLPGMFVSVKMGSPAHEEKILVSERIIGTDQDRKFVYVVGSDNKVQYREVKLGASMDGQRVNTERLKTGEKVITEGIMRIRPDMEVAPQAAPAAVAPASGAQDKPPEALIPLKESPAKKAPAKE
jgi:membrane fusion protein, multidrug efflux system